jgi:hypothetical protein
MCSIGSSKRASVVWISLPDIYPLHRRQHGVERVSTAVGARRWNGQDARSSARSATRQASEDRDISEQTTVGEHLSRQWWSRGVVLIGSVVNRELEPLQGKRISEIAEATEKGSARCCLRSDCRRPRSNRRDLFHDE